MRFRVLQLSRFYGIEGVGLKLDADLDSQYNGDRQSEIGDLFWVF